MLELLEYIEDMKIQIFSRDKAVELQEKHVEMLIEDLREAKQFESLCKTLQIQVNSLTIENKRLNEELEKKIDSDLRAEFGVKDKEYEKDTLIN